MDLFVIAFIIIILIGIRPMRSNIDYIGFDSTTAIKGIFAIIILFNHSRQYMKQDLTVWGGQSYTYLFNASIDIFGQLMVVMFLTYSGYGIMESFKKKREKYYDGFFRNRILKTLINFDIAVILYLMLALALGHQYSLKQYIFSFIGWDSIGNSNWFVFDIIILYLFTYCGLYLSTKFKLRTSHFLWIVTCLDIIFLLFLYYMKGSSSWWYDTLLAFPIGMFWSTYKEKMQICLENTRLYNVFLTLSILIFVFNTILFYHYDYVFIFIINVPLFSILVILLTMRLKIGNKVLYWLGINAFAIYILQRIPMIIASQYDINLSPVIFFTIVLVSSLLLASAFTKITNKINKFIFR